jgi:hypothetical protein
MNIIIREVQGKGKTAGMVFFVNRLVTLLPEIYTWDNVHPNIHIDMCPNYYTNEQIRKKILQVYGRHIDGGERGEHTKQIIVVDEIDGLYSHLSYQDKQMQKELLGLYQDEKMHNVFICTKHDQETGVNKIIRDFTEIIIFPEIEKSGSNQGCLWRNLPIPNVGGDKLTLHLLDRRFKTKADIEFQPFSWVFDKYKRWEAVE